MYFKPTCRPQGPMAILDMPLQRLELKTYKLAYWVDNSFYTTDWNIDIIQTQLQKFTSELLSIAGVLNLWKNVLEYCAIEWSRTVSGEISRHNRSLS